ncbi:MAG: type VII toxin-antitoxin system HepT family RNase toxin [Candidatus Ranarchaeia archaeon]
MNVDHRLIKTKLIECEKYLKKARELSKLPVKILQRDLDTQLQSERLFEIISETIIDICTHIIASLKLGVPDSYSSCPRMLSKENIISIDLAEDIAKMVKMRNIIVHQYMVVNYSLLHTSLKRIVNDFEKYNHQIIQWLNNNR